MGVGFAPQKKEGKMDDKKMLDLEFEMIRDGGDAKASDTNSCEPIAYMDTGCAVVGEGTLRKPKPKETSDK